MYNRFEKYKILRHYDKLKEIAGGKIVAPELLYIYPTNACMHNCWYCIMKEERANNAYLSGLVMSKIAYDCNRVGIKSVIFSGGGEPLINPNTRATIAELQEYGVRVGLNTNGVLLSGTAPDFVRVSIDACTPETFHAMHGTDFFDQVVDNIRNYKGKELGLAFLVTDVNRHEIVQFADWAQQFNPSFVHIRPAFLPNMASFDYSDIKAVVERYNNVFFRTEKFNGYFTPRLYDKCRATSMIGVLTADGRFAVCQDVFIKFGNYNLESFDEAWFSKAHLSAIESIDMKKCPRCVENGYNEIIQNCVIDDKLRMDIL